MSSYRNYTVGRSSKADIVLDSADSSVSGIHAELTISAEGHHFLADAGSSNGTYVRREDKWETLRQGYITADDQLRLGSQTLSAADLISKVPAA